MVTALVVVAGSGFIIGTAHEKEVSRKLLKEMEFKTDIRDFGIYVYYSELLSGDDPSDSQKALEFTRKELIRSWQRLKKLPQDHLFAKNLRVNDVSIDPLVQSLEHKIAEQAAPSDGDKPPK